MNKLEWALSHARRGLPVFPLNDQCEPDIVGWPEKATTDEDQIRAWFLDPVMEWPIDRNIGIATGNGVLAVDLDNKKGKTGSATFALLEDIQGEAPPTLKTKTPSGGYHLFFKTAATYANSVEKIGPGIDTRGHRGYVVAAGSERADGSYEIVDDLPLAPAPGWITAKLEAPRERAEAPETVTELDTPYAMMRAIRWLQDAPAAVEGSGGDQATFAVAAKLKDFGLSRGAAVQAMLEFWNERCSPPWHPRELEQKVVNAFRYGTSAPASLDPTKEFEAIEPESPRLFTPFEESRFDLSHPYLVEDLLDQGAMSVLYGDSNSGKTFLALDLSHCVATGRAWRGKKVRQGLVVYLAAEGGRAIHKRLGALRSRYGAADTPLAVVTLPVDLLRGKEGRETVLKAVRAAEEHYGLPCTLLVLDTLSRLMAGGNENAPDDMGTLVKNIDLVRSEIRAHVLTVHHSGKNAAAGARGHSLLRAATDTEIEVADRQVSVTKQRDQDYEPAFSFDLEAITLGEAPDGKAITSCLVRYPAPGQAPLTPDMKEALSALWQACSDAAGEGASEEKIRQTGVTFKLWVVNYSARKGISASASRSGVADKRLRTLRTIAEQNGFVEKTIENKYILKGADVADFCG